jgi:hypothetical protein
MGQNRRLLAIHPSQHQQFFPFPQIPHPQHPPHQSPAPHWPPIPIIIHNNPRPHKVRQAVDGDPPWMKVADSVPFHKWAEINRRWGPNWHFGQNYLFNILRCWFHCVILMYKIDWWLEWTKRLPLAQWAERRKAMVWPKKTIKLVLILYILTEVFVRITALSPTGAERGKQKSECVRANGAGETHFGIQVKMGNKIFNFQNKILELFKIEIHHLFNIWVILLA